MSQWNIGTTIQDYMVVVRVNLFHVIRLNMVLFVSEAAMDSPGLQVPGRTVHSLLRTSTGESVGFAFLLKNQVRDQVVCCSPPRQDMLFKTKRGRPVAVLPSNGSVYTEPYVIHTDGSVIVLYGSVIVL